MKKKVLWLLIIVIVITVISLLVIYYNSTIKVSDFKVIDESKKIEDAKKYGDDVVGWLRVEGTNIDLPLIMATDSTDLLKADYDFAWTNSIPDGTGNRPTYVSHNIRNISSNPIIGDDTMIRFEQLMSFIYLDFIKENQFIEFTNSKGDTEIYRIYGVSLLKDDQTSSFLDTYTLDEQERYIKSVKRSSMYDINVDVDKDDLMLTLITCTRFYGSTDSYSFKVDARKLRENEKMIYSSVDTNKNYDKIEDEMKEGEDNEKA